MAEKQCAAPQPSGTAHARHSSVQVSRNALRTLAAAFIQRHLPLCLPHGTLITKSFKSKLELHFRCQLSPCVLLAHNLCASRVCHEVGSPLVMAVTSPGMLVPHCLLMITLPEMLVPDWVTGLNTHSYYLHMQPNTVLARSAGLGEKAQNVEHLSPAINKVQLLSLPQNCHKRTPVLHFLSYPFNILVQLYCFTYCN